MMNGLSLDRSYCCTLLDYLKKIKSNCSLDIDMTDVTSVCVKLSTQTDKSDTNKSRKSFQFESNANSRTEEDRLKDHFFFIVKYCMSNQVDL